MKSKFTFICVVTPVMLILAQLLFPKSYFLNGIKPGRYFNSDSLALLDYSKVLFFDTNFYEQWSWGTHWFIFPDLFILRGLELLGLNEYRTLLGFGILSYLMMQYVALVMFEDTYVFAWVTMIAVAGLLNFTPFQDIWYPGFYFSAIPVALLIYYLNNSTLIKKPIILGLCALLSFSHQIYGAVILLLVLISLLITYVYQETNDTIKFAKNNFFPVVICSIFSYFGEITLHNRYQTNWGVTELNLKSIALIEFSRQNFLTGTITLLTATSLLSCLILLSGLVKSKYNLEYTKLIISVFFCVILITAMSLFAAGTEWLPRYSSGLLVFASLPTLVLLSSRKLRTKNE